MNGSMMDGGGGGGAGGYGVGGGGYSSAGGGGYSGNGMGMGGVGGGGTVGMGGSAPLSFTALPDRSGGQDVGESGEMTSLRSYLSLLTAHFRHANELLHSFVILQLTCSTRPHISQAHEKVARHWAVTSSTFWSGRPGSISMAMAMLV